MKDAGEYSGLHPQTLRKYIDQGLIKGIRIGTHRFVDTRELDRLMGESETDSTIVYEQTAIIYARVSTRKQQNTLVRQKDRLLTYCSEHNLSVITVIEDIASGVNETRRGLNKLFRLIQKRKAKYVVVESRDRLARFGVGYLQEFFKDYNVDLIVVHPENGSPEEDLVRDLIAIVRSFSTRLYGRRGANKIVQTIKKEVKTYAE